MTDKLREKIERLRAMEREDDSSLIVEALRNLPLLLDVVEAAAGAAEAIDEHGDLTSADVDRLAEALTRFAEADEDEDR